jgi:hypothetical protein
MRNDSSATQEEIQHFVEVSQKYGQQLASPEENTAVGITSFG